MPKALRVFLRGLAGFLFILLLLVTAIDIGAARVVTSPDKVKHVIAGSGIYGDVVPSTLRQVGTIDTGYGDIKVDNPIIEKAANAALPPPFIQQNTEMAIDNTYEWLDGKLPAPDFSINLSGVKTLFANKVAGAVQARINSLPICSLSQSQQILASGHYDALKSDCLPYGIDPSAIAEGVQASIKSSHSFLPDPTLTASDIKIGTQYIFTSRLKKVPRGYQGVKDAQLILIAVILLASAGIILLSRHWQAGLLWIGVTLIISGVIVLIVAWGVNHEVGGKVMPNLRFNGTGLLLQHDVRSILVNLEQEVDREYWYAGTLYLVLGLFAIGISKISRLVTNGSVTPSKIHKRRENPSRN